MKLCILSDVLAANEYCAREKSESSFASAPHTRGQIMLLALLLKYCGAWSICTAGQELDSAGEFIDANSVSDKAAAAQRH